MPEAPTSQPEGRDWAALRAPFHEDEIAYKPQPISKNITERKPCKQGQTVQHGNQQVPISRDGIFCGGFHQPSVHLTYVGHAALTERLDAVCGPENWNWEPFAVGPDGLPAIKDGSLWIRLTIWGVTKIGVGDHEGSVGPTAHKVMIGDALRNAGMRFGIARYLWDKSEKAREVAKQERGDDDERQQLPPSRPAERLRGRAQASAPEYPPLRDSGKTYLMTALASSSKDQLIAIGQTAKADAEQHGPQYVHPADVDPTVQRIFELYIPKDLLEVLRWVLGHLDVEGISVLEHVAAEQAAPDTTTTTKEP